MAFLHDLLTDRSRALADIRETLFNSRFFTLSVIFHIFLVMTVGSAVIINSVNEPTDFNGGDPDGNFLAQDVPQVPEVPEQEIQQEEVQPVEQPQNALQDVLAATADGPTDFTIPIAPPVITPKASTEAVKPAAAPKINAGTMKLSLADAKRIKAFTEGWVPKGAGGPGTNLKDRQFEFVAYLAKYGDPNDKTRGGDWASTNQISKERDGAKIIEKITKGSLPNLLFFMNRLSKGKIKAAPVPEPLDLSSDDIFIKKPPFIFFTGHRDFVLTEREVENLQKYVTSGGCIWGDSSLPGLRSRFDVAFRREMRRVIPDVGKDWETLPQNYPMFASKKSVYYPETSQPQPGVNRYKEPVYALRYADEVAIIYTPNDYGDMWKMALTEQLQFDLTYIPRTNIFVYSDNTIYNNREIYFRGVDLPAIINSYKFGMNVVLHLLTRWEDRIKEVPGI